MLMKYSLEFFVFTHSYNGFTKLKTLFKKKITRVCTCSPCHTEAWHCLSIFQCYISLCNTGFNNLYLLGNWQSVMILAWWLLWVPDGALHTDSFREVVGECTGIFCQIVCGCFNESSVIHFINNKWWLYN